MIGLITINLRLTGDFAAVNRNLRDLREDVAALYAAQNAFQNGTDKRTTDTDKLNKRRLLHTAMMDVFDGTELRLLAAELKVPYDELEGDVLSERCLSLALMMQRRGLAFDEGGRLAACSASAPGSTAPCAIARPKRPGTESVQVVSAGTGGHHFDGTAGQSERHGPDARLLGPVHGLFERRRHDVLFKPPFDPCHLADSTLITVS